MRGRTIILVSHHVQLCAPGAQYIVSLDNGRVQYSGDYEGFQGSGVLKTLVQSGATDPSDEKEEAAVEKIEQIIAEAVKHAPSSFNSQSSRVRIPHL